ncbi:MAG: hypothetical protein ABIR78_07025 [Ferruginibacter sp.]
MVSFKRYIISLSLFLLAIDLPAQNITGTWEGNLGNDQYLQLNIIQTGDKICGYTYDHVNADKRSFCKAFFEGRYDKEKKKLLISGKYFLQNSGGHVLMRLSLAYQIVNGVEILEQKPTGASVLSSMLSIFGIIGDDPLEAESSADYVKIKKVSDQPYELIELMKDCIARDKKKTDTVVKNVVPPKRKDSLPPVVKIIPPQIPKDSLPPVVNPPVVVKKENLPLPKTFTERKNKEQSRITVDVKSINLKVYDNAIMDGDTVSILYNGKLLLSHQLLSEKAIELNLELDEKQTHHEIILFAENLGSIPPNTALIVITAGTKRYELFASASLEENAVLVFDYRPK